MGDKSDYIWKTCSALGLSDSCGADLRKTLDETLLAKPFPSFARMLSINSTAVGWASPAASHFAENTVINMSVGNICMRTSYSSNGRFCDYALDTARSPGC
jgi:hypothetical protein